MTVVDPPGWRHTEVLLLDYLVTRPTGRSVRTAVERMLRDLAGDGRPTLLTMDFRRVRVLDASCADEIVGRLAERLCAADPPADAHLWLRGLDETQERILHAVLEHRGCVVGAEGPRGHRLLGPASAELQQAWHALLAVGSVELTRWAAHCPGRDEQAAALLRELTQRRLARLDGAGRAWICAPVLSSDQSHASAA